MARGLGVVLVLDLGQLADAVEQLPGRDGAAAVRVERVEAFLQLGLGVGHGGAGGAVAV